MKRIRFTILKFFFLSILIFANCKFPGLSDNFLQTISSLQFINNRSGNLNLRVQVQNLLGSGLTLSNNGEELSIPSNGIYTFNNRFRNGDTYDVTISKQPSSPPQSCSVTGGRGSFLQSDVNLIQVECGVALATISGTATGLSGTGLQLSYTGSGAPTVYAISSTSFALPAQSPNSPYTISISSQPTSPWQTCTITSPLTGTIPTLGLNISISCVTDFNPLSVQTVGIGALGTLGLGQELRVQVNGGEIINFTGDTTLNFPTSLLSGSGFSLAILNSGGNIATGNCVLATPTGVIGGPATSVIVNCSSGFLISGTISIPGGSPSSILGTNTQIRISNTGGAAFPTQDLSLAAGQTIFSFPTPIPGGGQFLISVLNQPSLPTQSCSFTSGTTTGTASSNISNLVLNCSLPSVNFSLASGVLINDNAISLTHTLVGTTLLFTLGDGTQSDPSCPGTGTVYSTSIPITSNTNNTIKAIACNGAWTPSSLANSGAYQLQVELPTASLASGSTLNSGSNVTFSSNTTSSWFCSNDANAPAIPVDPVCGMAVSTCTNGNSGNYTFPGVQNKNLKVVGCKLNYSSSTIASLNYNVQTYIVSGTITGLTTPFAANSFVLRNNGTDDTIISANGAYSFATAIGSGGTYSVTVLSSPTSPWQTCNISNSSGSISSSNVTNVNINCTLNSYTMSGNITSTNPLPSGLQVTNGVDTINVIPGSTNTPISFASSLNSGSTFNISITSEPVGLVCAISSSYSGTITNTNLTNVGVNCINGYRLTNGISKNKPAPLNFLQYRGAVSDLAGNFLTPNLTNGVGPAARFSTIGALAYDGVIGYIVDTGNHAIRTINPSTGSVNTLVGNGTAGNINGSGAISAFNSPRGLATDGTYLYISETTGNRIKRTLISSGFTETLAGDSSVLSPADGNVDSTNPSLARFAKPRGLHLEGEKLFIADRSNNSIRILNLRTLEVSTLATGAPLSEPEGLTIVGDFVYTCNIATSTIVRTHKNTGVSIIFAGTNGTSGYIDAVGTNSRFNNPHGITNDGSYLYVGDLLNHRVRRIQISTQMVTTVAGSGLTGSLTGVGVAANIQNPMYLLNSGNSLVFGSFHQLRNINENQLAAYYPLNDSYANLSGSIDLLPTGTPTATLGRFNEPNGAILFSSGNYLTNPTPPITSTSNLTLSAWVKWDGSPTGNEQQIIAVGNSNGYALTLRNSIGNKLTILQPMTGWGVNCQYTLATNTWTHILAISDLPGRWRMFINGKNICQDILSPPLTPSGNISIGGLPALNQYFSGSIANVRIFNRVLNEGEIQELAQDADPLLVGSSYSTAATGLLTHYTMDGTVNLDDSGPFSNLLTNFNATTPSIGKDGNTTGSFRFNGTNHQMVSGLNLDRGLPMGASPRSMCAWIAPEDYPSPGNFAMVSLYGSPGTTNGASTLGLHTDIGGIRYLAFVTTNSDALLPFTIPLNTWSHYCITYNGGTPVQFYVNGLLVGTANTPSALATVPNGFRIGNWHNNAANGGNHFFKGKIDDVRIYNSALSSIAIRQLATQVPTGLIRRYDFNGDLNDISGFGQNGTIVGTVTPSSDRNSLGNSAYSFPFLNGNYIFASDSGLPMGTSPRSMCAWYRGIRTDFSIAFSYGNENVGTQVSALWLQDETLLRFWGNGTDVNASVNLPYYVWNHVCLTFDGTQSQVFSNGRLVAGPSGHGLNTVSNPSNRMYLGSWVSGREFQGTLDEVRIYNRVLSNQEIMALSGTHPMQVTSWSTSPATSSLKFFYQSDTLGVLTNGAAVATWRDSSGNTNDLTSSTNITYLTNGINSKPSVSLNGVNSHMRKLTPIGVSSLNRFSFFSVISPTAFSGSYSYFIDLFEPSSCPGSNPYPNFFLNTNAFGGGYCASNNSWNTSSFLNIGQNYLLSIGWNNAVLDPDHGLNYVIFVNGIQGGGFNYPTLTPVATEINLGHAPGTAALRGSVSEILFFTQSLNTNNSTYGVTWKDKDIVECYLSAKYNIPTNHSCP